MTDFLAFSKNPVSVVHLHKWRNIYFIQYIILLVVLVSLSAAIPLILTKFLQISNNMIELNFKQKVIQGILIAPIAEELIFRLILRENKNNFYIFFITCLAALTAVLILKCFISLFIIIFIFFAGVTIFLIHYCKLANIYSQSNYRFLYWGSILIFGLSHGINYSLENHWQFLLIPLLTLPQIILGFILNHIRVKFGIKYSIAFHFIINLQLVFII